MPKKFIAFQIVLITFGIALFFMLADLKKRSMEKRDELEREALEALADSCDFPDWIGKGINTAALKKTGLFPLIVLSDLQQPDALAIGNNENTLIVRVDDRLTVVGVDCPFKRRSMEGR